MAGAVNWEFGRTPLGIRR